VEIHCHGVHSGGKIGNLVKGGGYLQEIFLQAGIAKHTNFAGGIGLFTLDFILLFLKNMDALMELLALER
jgi:hypothetical protein